uniref:Uncharacterized protein n=1 Tax=Strongyloides venezuelensis TaxID=75913 RepID=A0A0K0EXT3_STRVS
MERSEFKEKHVGKDDIRGRRVLTSYIHLKNSSKQSGHMIRTQFHCVALFIIMLRYKSIKNYLERFFLSPQNKVNSRGYRTNRNINNV